MKRYFLSLFAFLFIATAYAQSKREQIKALKISFLTERMGFTEKEAQEFWPVYNAYEEKTMHIKHKELRGIRREIRENLNTLTDMEAKDLLDKLAETQERLHQENKLLYAKLKDIIPAHKLLILKVAEEDFNRKLFEQYKRKRREQRPKD